MTALNPPRLTVLGLNELNFGFVRAYADAGHLPAFAQLLAGDRIRETTSEGEYHLLEPWIQWVTVQTGLPFSDHGVYRLGDIVDHPDLLQIFEDIESRGYRVGAVSPFNAANRLDRPAFFVPDPWTQTPASGGALLRRLSRAVGQAVNDNAEASVTIGSAAALASSLAYFPALGRYGDYARLAGRITRPGAKAIVLDSLLIDVFLRETERTRPDLAWLFLNTGAHLQHHYLFNSAAYEGPQRNPFWYCPDDVDPLLDVLRVYDLALSKLLARGGDVLVLTGLHQVPHDHATYYYRLRDHANFLRAVGVDGVATVTPRMSRDFLVDFDDEAAAARAETTLRAYRMSIDGEPLFTCDNRGASLFVELAYPREISPNAAAVADGHPTVSDFAARVAFVAIKNGEHHGTGYLAANYAHDLPARFPLTKVYDHILSRFPTKPAVPVARPPRDRITTPGGFHRGS